MAWRRNLAKLVQRLHLRYFFEFEENEALTQFYILKIEQSILIEVEGEKWLETRGLNTEIKNPNSTATMPSMHLYRPTTFSEFSL